VASNGSSFLATHRGNGYNVPPDDDDDDDDDDEAWLSQLLLQL